MSPPEKNIVMTMYIVIADLPGRSRFDSGYANRNVMAMVRAVPATTRNTLFA